MKMRLAIPILFALLVVCPTRAAFADAARDELAPSGHLRVAIAMSSLGGPFWSAKDTAGKPTGVPVDLGKEMARRLGVPVDYVMYENSGQITDAAAKGDEVSLNGFGKFKVKNTPAREGRNPSTGATIQIAASKKLTFAPAKAVKDKLNG